MKKKAAIFTLGCKVNQVESEQMKEDFMARGYRVVDFNQPADVYVVNTCTVTHVSDRKSRAMLRRARRKNPQSIVVAAGCFAEQNAEQLADMPEVDLIVGNRNKEKIVEVVERYRSGEPGLPPAEEWPSELKPVFPRFDEAHERTRAFIKVQDGCQSCCSYCIVPRVRGPLRSKRPEDVIEEARHLLQMGYRELVFTGIHTGMYGRDIDGWNLVQLLKEVLKLPGEYRLRLSSIETLEVSEELIHLLETEPRICRHLHIPLQSGSDRILPLMNRRYTRDFYRKLVNSLAVRVPGLALTSDVMVGFPTETEQDFLDTFYLIQDSPFYDLHVFRYSPRPGTTAARLSPQVDAQTCERRSRTLIQLAAEKKAQFIDKFVGQTLEVLIEDRTGAGLYDGLTDNYIRVILPGSEELRGRLVPVVLEENLGDKARGSVVSQ
ncbi:MAG: tRNA (N(6)-L-threonylcarbamoyladenosine(37)-C(2))-methylthiotransferase MtaB [Syntrophomonadaceae bacterium]|jgi:threonylcarbamoyladenosine tRNA methylthiotransferase MtaB|nr:tRNA (N(6)-L-threonylcarbamoyladenosine(37)-C(2))-methylthiotransferase MtaB [Syntrophomonadaceae bacterium]